MLDGLEKLLIRYKLYIYTMKEKSQKWRACASCVAIYKKKVTKKREATHAARLEKTRLT